jgi:hypothetical protein
MRRATLPALAFVALALTIAPGLAGCGKPPADATDAAELVPPGASSLLRVQTSQVARATRAAGLLARIRAGAGFARDLHDDLHPVPRSAGPELDVATIRGGRVFYTQPADEKAFAEALDARGRPHARIRGWTVFAASAALLDAVSHRRGSLAERAWYAAASATLPSDAAVGRVVRQAVPGWRATALSVHDADVELEVHRRLPPGPRPQAGSSLAAVVPVDAIAAAGVAGPGNVPGSAPQLIRELARAVGGPAVGWVRAGDPLPEVAIVSRPRAAGPALRATGAFLARLTKNPASFAVTLDGRPLRQVVNGPIDLYYGLVDGELIVTDSATAPGRLGSGSSSGSGGGAGAAIARLPDATESWAFVDLGRALPLAQVFGGLFGSEVPATLQVRLAPLRDLLVHSSHEGRVATVVTRIGLR